MRREINMEWLTKNTRIFIEMMYDRAKEGHLRGISTFREDIWCDIIYELRKINGEIYSMKRLKRKFYRLRTQYRQFSTLLACRGVKWDLKSNKVNAPKDVWQDLYKEGRYYRQFKKQGFQHDYDMLGEIFNSSTANDRWTLASSVKGGHLEWTIQNTRIFIEIIYDRVKRDHLQGPTFSAPIWKDINKELTRFTGQTFGIERLERRFNRLRDQHSEFSTLLDRMGVEWDPEYRDVYAPEYVWQEHKLYLEGRYYKQFKKRGFPHNYDMLGEIFNSITATGKLSLASTGEPLNSAGKQELEEDFLSKGVGIHEVEYENLKEAGQKRKAESSSERQRKEAKTSKLENLEASLSHRTGNLSTRSKASKVKSEESTAKSNSATDPYSIDACMDLLNSMITFRITCTIMH